MLAAGKFTRIAEVLKLIMATTDMKPTQMVGLLIAMIAVKD